MFIRLAKTLVGHDDKMVRPLASEQFDFEGELALVIARPGDIFHLSERLIMLLVILVLSMEVCVTIKSSLSRPEKTFPLPGRLGRGLLRPMRSQNPRA